MSITFQTAGAIAYSAQNGTSVSPAYPTSNAVGEKLILILGMKPSTANSGSVTTPSNWTLVTSITGAGGYGTTLGADTGNTNLFVYERTVPTGGLSGTLAVTVATNNVCWAFMCRLTNTSGYTWDSIVGATGEDTTGGNVSISFSSNPAVTTDDFIIGAMCIPTDVSTPNQFSAPAFTQTGVTFGTVTEINEPDSGTGNDIGGFSCRALVSSGTGSANPVMTATAGGTTTNVRGGGVFIRVREKAPITADLAETASASDSISVTQIANATISESAIASDLVSPFKTVIILNSGTSWTVPNDWDDTKNIIEVWGGGAGGHSNNNVSLAGAGGGGGYSSISNLSLTPSASIAYAVGTGGVGETLPVPPADGGGTWFNGTSVASSSVSANGGLVGTTGGAGGLGGTTTGAVGTLKYAGGDGGSSAGINTTTGAGGGAGASPFGAGNTGGSGIVTGANTPTEGAVGGNSLQAGSGGAGGAIYTPWLGGDGVANPSGGGGGGGGGCGISGNTAGNGGNGAIPAGGGGSGCTSRDNGSNGGAGGTGQIRISYNPIVSRYWVGGAGTWNASNTANWSLTSGGTGGASVPDSTMNAVFDGGSDVGSGFTVTLSGTIACRDWIIENHDVTINVSGSPTLSIHRNLRWIPVANNITTSSTGGTVNFSGGAGITQSIAFGNVNNNFSVRFAGTTTTTYNIASDYTGGSTSVFTLVNGILNTQNYAITLDRWTTEAGTSTTNLGSSTITITGYQGLVYGSGRTFNAGTSTIRFTYSGGLACSVTLPNYTLHNIEFTSTNYADFNINVNGGNLTCNNFTVTNATNGRKRFLFGDSTSSTGFLTLTINGTLSVTGSVHRYCSTFTTSYFLHNSPITISANAVSLNYVNFYGIAATGAAAPFTGTSLGDGGWNSGITFTAPKTTYFRGAAGTTLWATINTFSATSGGSGAEANYPLPQDSVIVDENTLSSTISSADNNIRPEFSTFDASARTTALTFSRNSRIQTGAEAGAIKTPAAVTWNATGDGLYIHGDCEIDVVNALNTPIIMRIRRQSAPVLGTVKLLRNLTHNSSYAFTNLGGLLDLNGFTATLWSYVTGETNSDADQPRGLFINGGSMNLAYSAAHSYALICGQNQGHTFVDGEYIDFVGNFPSNTIYALGGLTAGLSYAPSIRLGGTYATYVLGYDYFNSIDGTSGNGAVDIGAGNSYYGDIKVGSGITLTSAGGDATLIGTKTSVIDSAVSVPTNIIINRTGSGKVSLTKNLTISSSKSLTLTAGALDLNDFNLSTLQFLSSNSNTRSIAFGTGVFTITGTTNAWNMATGLNCTTTDISTGRIKFTNSSPVQMFGGRRDYPTIELAGSGKVSITDTNQFWDMVNSVQPSGIVLEANKASLFYNGFNLRGTAGNLVTIERSGSFPHYFSKDFVTDVDTDYLAISNNEADPTGWYAGTHSQDNGGNTGWFFSNAPQFVDLSETASSSDSSEGFSPIVALSDETASASDAMDALFSAYMQLSETASATESLSALFNTYTALSETTNATDSIANIFSTNQLLSETASASDSSIATFSILITLSETASATDNYAQSKAGNVALSETANATDSILAIFNVYTSTNETASATDSALANFIVSLALNETASASDSVAGGSLFAGALSETASATESENAAFSVFVTVSESAGSSDSILGVITFTSAVSESASATESEIASFIVNLALSETATATDSISNVISTLQAMSETVSASDSVTNLNTAVVILSESASASDSVIQAFATNKAVSETASATDSLTVLATEIGLLSETVSASDSATRAIVTTATISETASGTDSVLALANRIAALSESVSATELQAAIFNVYLALSESATATESIDGTGGNNVFLSESASATDTITALFNVYMALSETASASDGVTGVNSTNQAINEIATATEGIAVLANVFKSLSESASASDSVDKTYSAAGNLSESVSATSEQDFNIGTNGLVIESVSATESVSGLWTTLAVVVETANATESLAVNINVQTSVLESAVAGDSQSATALWLASLAESVSASDSLAGARITDGQVVEIIVVGDTVFAAVPAKQAGAFLVFFVGAGLAPIVH